MPHPHWFESYKLQDHRPLKDNSLDLLPGFAEETTKFKSDKLTSQFHQAWSDARIKPHTELKKVTSWAETTHSKDGAYLLIHLYHRSPPRHPVAIFQTWNIWNCGTYDLFLLRKSGPWHLSSALSAVPSTSLPAPLWKAPPCSRQLHDEIIQQNLATRALFSLSTSNSAILSPMNLTTHVSAWNIQIRVPV